MRDVVVVMVSPVKRAWRAKVYKVAERVVASR
jgi:hypothetical protein